MNIKKRNALRKAKLLTPYLVGEETILDFCCGDLSLDAELHHLRPNLKITGIDLAKL